MIKVIHQVYHQGDMLTFSNVNGKFILQVLLNLVLLLKLVCIKCVGTCLRPGTVPMGSPLDLVQVMLGSGTPLAWQIILVPVVLLKST